MGAEKTVRLTLLAHKKRLPELPGQPSDTRYGIVWDACPIPHRGSCYVVRFVGHAEVQIVGYISRDGCAFHASEPLEEDPSQNTASLVLTREKGEKVGAVLVRTAAGDFEHISDFRGALAGTMREVAEPATWNTERSLAYREFMATLYLRYCVFLQEDADPVAPVAHSGVSVIDMNYEQLAAPVEIFRDFKSALLPDAIATLLFRIEANDHASGIERYAHRVLTTIDMPRLRSLATIGEVNLAYIEHMNGFYINCNRDVLTADDLAFLFGIEARLNRLSAILGRMGAGLGPVASSPSEAACAELDRVSLESVTSHVDRLVHESGESLHCAWSEPGGIACRPGGEWDVRMHLAEICEQLNVLVRLEYRFDYRAQDGLISLQFIAPTSDAMSFHRYDCCLGAWVDIDCATRERMAKEYARRVALVLAAACFAASPSVERCEIEAFDTPSDQRERYAFDRAEFRASIAARAHDLMGTSLVDGGAGELVARMAIPGTFCRIVDNELLRMPRDDNRLLPDDLRELLHADTAAELEVVEDENDPYRIRLARAREAAESDLASAESMLHELIDEIEAVCVGEELLSNRPAVTQFCENHVGRLILPLYLPDAETRVLRAPDALYFAQHELCALHLARGALDLALVEARRLLDFASTSTQAHFMLINVLARLRMFDDVIEVVKHGLRTAYDRDAIAYLYYRLAFAYWNRGDRLTALACYRLVPAGEHISAVAQEEARELMGRMGLTTPLDFKQAVTIVKAAGVPVPPTEELFNHVANVAVLLLDNGFFYLAARCVYIMWRMTGKDELGVLSKSLLME